MGRGLFALALLLYSSMLVHSRNGLRLLSSAEGGNRGTEVFRRKERDGAGADRLSISGGYIPEEALEMMDGFEENNNNKFRSYNADDGRLLRMSSLARSSNDPGSSSSSSSSSSNSNSLSPTRISGNEAEFEVTTINDNSNSNNQLIKAETTELGKDKELFHLTLDFVRVWEVVSQKATWRAVARKMMKAVARVTGRDDYNVLFREVAVDMLSGIRRQDRSSPLKLFKGTMKQAEAYARQKGAFIIVYIEDYSSSGRDSTAAAAVASGGSEGSVSAFRAALSDPALGRMLNEEFVFFAGSTRHNPTFRLARMLGPFKKKDFPLFVALTPSYVDAPVSQHNKGKKAKKHPGIPEKLAVLQLPAQELVDTRKIAQFLMRVKKVHGPTLQARRKEFLELLEAQDNNDKAAPAAAASTATAAAE